MTSSIVKVVKSTTIHFVLLLCFILSPHIHANQRPEIQLATKYRQGLDIGEYWISEKLDGVRAYWDGKQLISRQGNVFWAPKWFTKSFPNRPLDGELWIDRGQFELLSGTVRQKRHDNPAWQKVKLLIFDLPQSTAVFSRRVDQMAALVEQARSPYLQMIEQRQLDNTGQLNDWLDQVVAAGGEGLMLHRGQAQYLTRRSPDLMKLKKYSDAEAVVLQHLPGKGKFTGKLGALLVKAADGIVFKIGSGFSNQQRDNPPAVGSIITFKYYGKTVNNVPRFASFMRIRRK